MLKRVVPLKRNLIILQLLVFLPFVFVAGVVAYFIHYMKFTDWDKIFLTIAFLCEIILAVKTAQKNKEVMHFSDKEILIASDNKDNAKIKQQISSDRIKTVICNDKKKNITFLLYSGETIEFFKFAYTNFASEEVYFRVKAEMCRYFPTKTLDIRDKYIEEYLEKNTIPQYIQSKMDSQRCSAIILICFEIIFAIIPIGLTILSLLWSILTVVVLILKGIVVLLNLFLK